MVLDFLMMDNISFGELFIVLFVIYIFFGVKVIPKLFQSFKKAWTALQHSLHEIRKEIK